MSGWRTSFEGRPARPLALLGLLILVLLGGWYALRATDDGHAERRDDEDANDRRPMRLAPGKRPGPLVVPEPDLPVTVLGRVLDPRGRPLAGATLRWVLDQELEVAGYTDAAGRYVLRGPVLCGDLEVSYGELHRAVVWMYVEDREDVPVRLRAGKTLEGVVRAADGTPAAGAAVSVSVRTFGRSETETDATGRFRLVPVPADEAFHVHVEAGRWGRKTVKHVMWTEGATLEVRLPEVFSVRGRVVRGDPAGRSAGVPGVHVVSGVRHGRDGPGAVSGSDGRFELEGLTREGYVGVASDVWCRKEGAHATKGASDLLVTVVPRALTTRAVRGRVVDDAGGPVEGAVVDARYVEPVASADDGSFALEGLPRVESGNLVWASRGEWYGSLRVPGREDAADVRLELDRRPSLRGRLIDETGAPVAYAGVAVSWKVEGEHVWSLHSESDVSDASGAFHVVRLGRHAGTVTVEASGYVREVLEDVLPVVGGLDLGDVVLTRCVRRSGRVTDEDGVPIPTAAYRIYEALNYRDMPVSADGTFEVDVAPSGAFRWLRVEAPGYVPIVIEPEGPPYPERFDVVLRRVTPLRGRVVDREERPVPGLHVRARPSGSTAREGGTYTDLRGEFRLEMRRPGSYRLVLDPPDPGGPSFAGEYRVSTDGDVLIHAVVPGRIAGEVLDLGGRPVADVTVVARIPGTYAKEGTVTDRDGRFVFETLKGDVFDLTVEDPPDGLGFRPLYGIPVGRDDVRFVAEPTYSISGVVVWGDGRPAVEADVNAILVADADVEEWAETDERGRFTIAGLVGGRYRLEAWAYVEIDDETEAEFLGIGGEVDANTSGHRLVLRPAPPEEDEDE